MRLPGAWPRRASRGDRLDRRVGRTCRRRGIAPGYVIAPYAGEPVEDSLDLQRRVVGTRPGTGVAVDVVRNGEPVTLDVTVGELNLDAESRSVMAVVAEETSEGFGITLQDLTSQMIRRLSVPDDTVGAVVADIA